MVTLRSLSPVALLVCLALAASLPAQSPSRPHWFQEFPATEPLRIFDAAIGDPGVVWVAAEQGIFRFDGVRYHRLASHPFPKATFLYAAVGHVWVGGAAGLAHFANGSWRMIHRQPVTAWQRTAGGFWSVNDNQLTLRSANGEVVAVHPAPSPATALALRRDRLWFLRARQLCSVPADGRGPLVCQAQSMAIDDGPTRPLLPRITSSQRSTTLLADLLFSPAGRPWWIRPDPPPPGVASWTAQPISDTCELFVDESSRWICADDRLALSRRDEAWESWSDRPAPGIKAFWSDPRPGSHAGRPLLGFGRNGVSRFAPSSRRWVRLPNLPVLDVRAMLDDGFGGYWLATMQRGLLRVDARGAPLEQLHPCHSLDTYRLLVRDSSGRVWIGGKDPGCFFELRGRPGAWSLLPQTLPGNNLQAVALAEDPNQQLWVGYEDGLARRDAQGQWQPVVTTPPVGLVRELLITSRDVLWVAHRRSGSFTRLERTGDGWRATPHEVSDQPGDTYFLRRDSRGWLWRGTDGAVWVSRTGPDQPQSAEAEASPKSAQAGPARHQRARNAPLLPGPSESVVRDSSESAQAAPARHQGAKDSPLLPGPSESVVRVSSDDWIRLDKRSGVPFGEANLGGFHEDAAGFVWLAGVEGIVRIKPDPSWFLAPSAAPLLARVAIPGREWLDAGSMPREFPAGVSRITFEWSTLRASPFRSVPIRFRWAPDGPWQSAPDARAVLDQPAAGSYTLEAVFTGEGQPPVAEFSFRVTRGASNLPGWLPGAAAATLPLLWWGWRRREWVRYRLSKLFYLAKVRGYKLLPSDGSLTGRVLLSRYSVGELHAQGGFARVYRASDSENPHQPIVLKVLSRTDANHDELRRRFSQEVAALSSVSHPHIPPLLDSFVTSTGEPALVLPFYAGPSLRDLLRLQGPLAPARVALLAEQIGQALLAFHAKGFIHRDVKPDNILYRDPDHVMLLDFGAATSRGAVGEVEHTGTITGSLHYLAPERLLGQYSPASDLFALAVVLLECLSGQRPAQLAVAPQDPAFPSSVATWMNPAIAEALMEALRHQPDRRPADFASWLHRLVTLLRAANSSS
jgi:tRNA A-37 threonylcarbamoyl transferase component Bud32